jgi:hypothetical protein
MNTGRHEKGLNDQDQFGLLVAARLNGAVKDLPHDITERLRAARVRAVAARKVTATKAAPYASANNGTLVMGGEHLGRWGRLAALAPLVALVLGLIFISIVQDDNQANELAEIDAAILTDDLPPSAYADVGFTEFVKLKSGKISN